MLLGAIISLSLTALIFILSLSFKVAGKLRLTLPLLYFFAAAISTLFTDWTSKNEKYVLLGLYILIGIVVLSWIYSLIKAIKTKHNEKQFNKAFEDDVTWQIRRARELGLPVGSIRVKEDGTVVHADTGEPILPFTNRGRPL